MATPPNPLNIMRMHKPGGRNVGTGSGVQPQPDSPQLGSNGGQMDGASAGYMELEGAQKDADCSKVQVEGGVSSDLGNCHEFEPQQGAQSFNCGSCANLQKSGAPEEGAAPDAGGNSQPVVTGQP